MRGVSVVPLLCLVGCGSPSTGSTLEAQVRALAATEISCEAIEVTPGSLSVDPADPQLWNAEGCGQRIVYSEQDGQVRRHDGSFYAP